MKLTLAQEERWVKRIQAAPDAERIGFILQELANMECKDSIVAEYRQSDEYKNELETTERENYHWGEDDKEEEIRRDPSMILPITCCQCGTTFNECPVCLIKRGGI